MTLDLSKYMIQDSSPQDFTQEQTQSEFEPLDLDKFISVEDATAFDAFKRHTARIGSRIGESIVGFPGDFVKFVQFMADKLPHVPTGEPDIVQKMGKRALEKLPTSEDVKQFSEQYTKGYTKAQGPSEEFGDEIASLAGALMIPARDPRKFTKFLSALGKNLPGAAVKASAVKGAGKGVEMLGAGPKTKTATELGMLFLTGLMGKKTANQYVSEKYKEARSAIPEGDIISTDKLLSGLSKVEKDLGKGVSTATKSEVLSPLKEIQTKAIGGGMLVDDLVESYHNINEKMSSKRLFDELSKPERALLKRRYDMLKNEISSTLKDYGKENPEFYKRWLDANQGYATIAQSRVVSDFISKRYSQLPKHLAGSVVVELLMGKPTLAASTLAAAGAGTGIVKSGELLYRISKSPVLRKHYLDVINAAGSENLPAMIKSIEILEKELKER